MTENKLKDTNNIRISQSKENPDNSVIWTPYNYRCAQAAIKAVIAEKRQGLEGVEARKVGGFFLDKENNDGFWFVKGLTEAQKTAVIAAAGEDVALGVEGRKAREEALKAERATKAPKEKKVEKTAEELEADKAARAEANRVRAAERDQSRVLVDAGSVAVGGSVEKDGVKQDVAFIGASFEKDGKTVAYAYFGELGADMAAKAAAKEAEKEAEEDAAPSM
ncbi:hypothetical protein LAZ40_07125 [Cereibacter sphaeroides]|uniref:hypothetical protein n=1 Tax=Cereibacter sphaeroides TaxID=1063 RepID=UPI001F39CDA3|nr:hypothetical protein [Cereibacter sphaeroides]MCE6958820.1 hypothetical protein [Cereibacter sphaeroides]MCE6973306.1 hypothetical protein [Cereibacter sphaeroides]